MIHIVYKIKASETHGIGLFADQKISAGDLICTPSPLLDVDITKDQFENLTPEEKKEVEYYGYYNKKTRKWHVAFDAIRILNHSDREESNVTQNENMVMTAKKNISEGEELLQDYAEIYPKEGDHFARIIKKI